MSLKEKFKKIFTLKKILLILICLGMVGGIVYYFFFRSTTAVALNRQMATVTKGDITNAISGTGTLVSASKSDITPRVSGTITKLYFKEGDAVKAGDLMFEMDDTDALVKLRTVEDNISQTTITYNNNLDSRRKLNLTAPFEGQVTNIQLKEGDVAGKNATVLTLTDLSKIKLQVPFNANALGAIRPDQSVVVYLADLMQSLNGRVTYVNNKAFSSADGGQIFYVEVNLENPGSLLAGMKASAEIQTEKGKFMSTNYGVLAYINHSVIKTEPGGEVISVLVKENEFVSKGQSLLQFENTDLDLSKESTESKLADLNRQLSDANKQMENFKVYAPIDGIITKQDLNIGDTLKQGDVVSSISNTNLMQFSMNLDELDIDKIKVGQKASVTIDAIATTLNNPLSGTVTKIAIEGTTSNGVTTYPVTVTLDQNEKLKIGMNVNGQIIIEQKKGAARLPIQAVSKRGRMSFVWVKGNEGISAENPDNSQQPQRTQGNRTPTENTGNPTNPNTTTNPAMGANTARNPMVNMNAQTQAYYQGYIQKPVTVGINDEQFIEILSGLNLGEEVLLPPVFTSQNTTTNNSNNNSVRTPFTGGGGIPGGGGFGGGGFGGNTGSNNQQRQGNTQNSGGGRN